MSDGLRRLAAAAVRGAAQVAGKTRVGRYFGEQSLALSMGRTAGIVHRGVELQFVVPNGINRFRVNTFATKEPETLEWIDRLPGDAVLWDVGANVGLYTCYAAKARGCRVFAFEPSVFNLELLARNLQLNGLVDRVVIVPLPLSDRLAVSTLGMTTVEWGGAMSTFGQSFGHDGEPLRAVFGFRTVGLSMTDAVRLLAIPQPDYIKMDVDGIEHLILSGGSDVLRQVTGVLIEVNDDFHKQATESARCLTDAGLVLVEKRQAKMFEASVHKGSYNQIWHRSS